MNLELSNQDWQLLSAYLDDQLDARQKVRLEARLNTETILRQGLQNLERTRLLLRSAPRRKAPRDFRLDPSPVPSRSYPVLFPVFSFASAVAALLFVILVLTDTSTGLRQQQFETAETIPVAEAVELEKEVVEAEAPVGEAELPPLINWAPPPSGPAMGIGGSGGGGGDGFAEPMDEGIAPAPQLLLEEPQEESMAQPEEEVAAEMEAETDAVAAPQEKEAAAQEAPPPAAGEALPEPLMPEESAEIPREIPEPAQEGQAESEPLDAYGAESDQLPAGPILGIQPSSTPAQVAPMSVEEIETERQYHTAARPMLKWLFAAAALLFGIVAVVIRARSR